MLCFPITKGINLPERINGEENYEAWTLWLMELDEAREHLADLIQKVNGARVVEESVLATDLSHIYAHLNRDGIPAAKGQQYPQING